MANQQAVNIGIVGFNLGGRIFHAPLIDAAEGIRVAGIVARSDARQADARTDYPDLPIFQTITDMAEHVDAVAISTPLETHLELAREAIHHGLPTVIDKPFGPTAQDARKVLQEAEAKGVLLTVYHNRRWDADYLTLKSVAASSKLGDLWLFESRMEEFAPPGGVSDSGGGILLDFGSHVMDQALHIFGPAKRVYAETHPIPGREELEDRFFAAVLHENGMRSHLTGDGDLQGAPAPRFRLMGTEGSFAIPSHDGVAGLLREGGRKSTHPERWGKVPKTHWGKLERPGEAAVIPSEDARWPSFYEGFARAVRGEGPLPVDPWDALAALELLDAAKESAQSGEVVAL